LRNVKGDLLSFYQSFLNFNLLHFTDTKCILEFGLKQYNMYTGLGIWNRNNCHIKYCNVLKRKKIEMKAVALILELIGFRVCISRTNSQIHKKKHNKQFFCTATRI